MAIGDEGREKINWLLIEGLAIVVSILFAFSIDAWWEDLQEQEDLHELLIAVRADFETSKKTIEYRRTFTAAKKESIIEVFNASFDDPQEIDKEALDRYLGEMFWQMSDMPIDTGALDALTSSGLVGSIISPDLRRSITAWPSLLDYISGTIEQDYDVYFHVWHPFIRDNGYLPQIGLTWIHAPGNPNDPGEPFPLTTNISADHTTLLADKRFHNVLAQLWTVQIDMQGAYDTADFYLQHSIDLIDAEIGPSIDQGE